MWSTRGEAGVDGRLVLDRLELDVPHPPEVGALVEEVEQRAADAADRGDRELARADGAAMDGREESLGAAELGGGIAGPQAERGDRGAVGDEVGVGEALLLHVEHEVDLALRVAFDVLGEMAAGVGEAHRAKQGGELFGIGLVDGELEEGGAFEGRLRGQGEAAAGGAGHGDERALAVGGDAAGRGHAEAVVEDLVADPAGVARRRDRIHERGDGQVALPREETEVTGELEDVHVDRRRVGELDEGEAVGGDRGHRRDRIAGGEGVEAVEEELDAGVVGAADNLPGVAPVAEEPAPGQRLEGNLDAEGVGDLAERAQVVGRAVDAAERLGGDVGADAEARARRARSSSRACGGRGRTSWRGGPRACPRSRGTAGRR